MKKYFHPGQKVRIKYTREVYTVVDDNNGGLVYVKNEQGMQAFYKDILTSRSIKEKTQPDDQDKEGTP